MRKLFPLLLIVALVVPSSFPGHPILSVGAVERRSMGDLSSTPQHSGTLAPLHPSSSAPPLPTGLYRSRVAVRQPADWARLEKLEVAVLERGEDWALVLADEEQLEALARLRFQPQSTDELGVLVTAHAQAKPWLVTSLRPLLEQAAAAKSRLEAEAVAAAEAYADVQASLRVLTPEQMAGVSGLSSVDDDADGLTNTQEQWWCTDPLNPDTDGDGTNDGAEAQAAKDWLANAAGSYPSTGKPFSQWPPQIPGCVDDDQDSVPDLAERWELGLNMNRESTDRDKFDDGQELFGNTYCPGSGGYCGYGALPRNEDWGVIFAEMPSWVQAPGNHSLVAAFPVPEIDVVQSSLHVETVTTVTTDHTIGEGTERSYSTAKTEGTSTSVANTTTWNDWQETSVATPQGASAAIFKRTSAPTGDNAMLMKYIGHGLSIAGAIGGVACAVATGGLCVPLAVAALGGAALAFGADALEDADNVQKTMKANQCDPNASYVTPKCLNQGLAKLETQVAVNLQSQTAAQQDLARGDSGTNYRIESDQRTVAQPIYQVKYLQPKPQIVKTETSGKSWGGAQTTTSEQYEEHTITNGEAFSSEESWGTATAVDSSHAADLWFTYRVRNTGAEYAREIGDLAFNIYIGDDPNPAITYFVAPELGGDGKFHNFMPNEEHTYTSRRIPLSLEQLKAIEVDPACAILRSIGQVPPYDPNDESTHCPGSKVRIVVEDFTYGIDELFYEDAVNSGVLVAIEDGTDDGDEETDTHLIPTWGEETVLDVLARYFPHTTDAYGNLIAIWTPEIRADTPSWCVEPRVVGTGGQRTLWCKHALSTADWWNVYTDGLGDGSEGFQDTPASPGSVALFRFNKDSDLDGYSDRSERRLGTDPNDPADHPQPELIAGVHSIRNGDLVVSTLSLLNTGLYDAYGVEAVMIAPDDSISITNNTVGGSGRVRAQRQVIVGSRILLQSPLPDPWTQPGHAVPAVGGYYTGQEDRTYTFSVTCSNPSGCDVGSGTWSLGWNDGAGATGSLNFGAGYASPTFLDVGAFGVQLALYSGKVYQGESFTVEARTPRDTFQYTINEEPHTEPVVIVSYNDPQGNHRFITPVALGHPADDLVPHSGGMLEDFGAEIVTMGEFVEGANTTNVVVNLPVDTTIVDAHLFLEFITTADISIPEDPDAGIVVHEVPMTVTLPAGPSVVSIAWDSDDFNPTYDPDVDYIVMAFWTDHQGNILDTAARPLSSFQGDPKPTFATDETTLTRDFGDVPRGEVLNHRIPLANIGFTDLLAHVSDSEHVSEATQWVGFTNANWVREIAKEGNYLWAATSGGAVAHDLTNGSYVKFTTVDDGLVDNDVLSVSIDGAGRKWFGTSSGISVLDDNGSSFDKADDAWISFTTTDGLVGNAVRDIAMDGASPKWFAAVGGLSVLDDNGTLFDKSDDQWQSFTTADGLACSNRGQAIAVDEAGRKWIGCGWDGVSVLDDGGTPFNKSDDQWQSFNMDDGMRGGPLISSIAIDGAGRKWIGAWSYPGWISVLDDNGTPFDKSDDQWQTFSPTDGLAQDGVQSVVVDGAGYKWFGTNGGVSVLNDNGTPFNKADDTWVTFTTADGLAANRVNDILIDGSGRKWFGTEGGGVSVLEDNSTPFEMSDDYWQTLVTTDSLANNNITTLVTDSAGRKWIGTYDGGAQVFDDNSTLSDESDDRWQTFTTSDGLPSDIVYAIAIDGDGRKWFGGHEYRVSVLDDKGTPFDKADDQWCTLAPTKITNDIVIDSAGYKWFGSWDGVSVLNDSGTPCNTADDQWITLTTADGLASNRISGGVTIDGANRKWFGTEGGVSMLHDNGTPFNKADDTWVSFTAADGLEDNCAGAIVIDNANHKWIPTRGGVSVLNDNGTPFNKADDTWVSFTITDGLANNWATGIAIDGAGRKWIATRGGVSVLDDNDTPFNKADDTWTTYTTADGLTSNSVNCLVLDGAGNKWFGTAGGVSVLLDAQEGIAEANASVADGGRRSAIDSARASEAGSTRTQSYRLPPADMAMYAVTVHTRRLPTGPYTRTVSIRTSDPVRPVATVWITVTIGASSSQNVVPQAPSDLPDVVLDDPDIDFGVTDPTETDKMPVTATLRNLSTLDSGPLTVAFFATPSGGFGETYIGAAFVSNIPAGGTADANIEWNTLGFTGDVPVRVVADPFNRVAETDENNNQATASLTIKTRPDLHVTAMELSDDEPVVGETVTVRATLHNGGQTDAGSSTLAFYDGNPESGGLLLGEGTPSVPGGGETALEFTWTPAAPGSHRLFAISDRDNAVSEFDEGNNQTWRDVYVGFAGPLLLDSGNPATDPAYTSSQGYGYVDEGQADIIATCGDGTLPEETLRQDPGGQVVYRFDYLLPGHFYHLDVTLYECDGAGRQESIYMDGNLVAGPEDLGDGQVHRLSLRLDPALYADHTVVVSIEAPGIDGAVVSEVNLHDVDYRYADAGGANDPQYPAGILSYGWLDGVANTAWDTLPYKSVRVEQNDNELRYRFDGLDPAKNYNVHLTFWQGSGATRIQKIQIDGADTGTTVNVETGVRRDVTVAVPQAAYQGDGSIVVGIVRTDGATTGAMVNEIALEEETLMVSAGCVAPVTPFFTEVYGSLTININGQPQPAPVGTAVQAISPRGDTVGCFVVHSAGLYGLMRIYGEDPTATPPIPGMRAGEPVAFRVNGAPAVATPPLYWQDDRAAHRVDLAAGGIEGQSILVKPGWNLFSFRVEPPAPLVQQVLESISGRYDRVLGENGVYAPSLPDVYNTLKELHSKQAYYLRLTGSTSANLLVEGLTMPVTTPIPLHQGWNWIGYLPTCTLPITVALQSIEGHYQRVLSLDKTYDPTLPDFSTLREMQSGEGYLIYANDPVTLTYPACGGALAVQPSVAEAICAEVAPTPYLTLLYGYITVNGEPAPAGTRVDVLTSRGEVAGCFVVERAGQYGLMHVYGADETADPPIGGFRAGEPLAFRVNGLPAEPSAVLLWQDDREPHAVFLSATVHRLYLPVVRRE